MMLKIALPGGRCARLLVYAYKLQKGDHWGALPSQCIVMVSLTRDPTQHGVVA